MEQQKVKIGRKPGRVQTAKNTVRFVAFEGTKLGSVARGDTRGVRKTLYDTGDRLVLHVKDWSQWVGESTTYDLYEVTEDEIVDDDPKLAREAGFDTTADLDDVL